MKRILAGIIAVTTVLCAFTGCGSTDDEKTGGNETSVESSAENEEETSEAEDAETDKDSENDTKDDKIYEDIINEYFDAINSKDYEKAVGLQLPKGSIDVVKLTMLEKFGESEEDVDIDKKFDEYFRDIFVNMPNLKLKRIVSIEDLDDEERDALKEVCVGYAKVAEYIENQGGINNVDLDKVDGMFDDFDVSKEKDSVKLSDAKYVSLEFLAEGEDEPETEEYYIYCINDNEWHIDNSVLAYGRKSKKASANSYANTLLKAGNTALVEMDEEGILPAAEKMLVCSDESKNINVPADFDTTKFKKKLNNYFGNEEKLDWFIVINEGVAGYAVAVEKGKSQIGTYPVDHILSSDGETESDDTISSKSFDEVYDICADALK